MDGSGGRVALGFIGCDLALRGLSVEVSAFEQAQLNTPNSIFSLLNQLVCLSVTTHDLVRATSITYLCDHAAAAESRPSTAPFPQARDRVSMIR